MSYSEVSASVQSITPVTLSNTSKEQLRDYFENTWELYELLFSSIKEDLTYYKSPDALRNPLIFYWGHTAAFYINKMVMAGLLKEGVNEHFEDIFARGVDPDLPENLDVLDLWPKLEEVNEYRRTVFDLVTECISNYDGGKIDSNSPMWAILMGIEHDRIHFETSSVLLRQLPPKKLIKPEGWEYASNLGLAPENPMIQHEGGEVELGKPESSDVFGWDNEYGSNKVQVAPFEASTHMITNEEFLEFFDEGGYDNPNFWSEEGWEWKNRVGADHPKFWKEIDDVFEYRAMFDVIDMPFDWPVEVNAHEAHAYCNWRGHDVRLLSEAEFKLISKDIEPEVDPFMSNSHNLNFKFGSPSPVGKHSQASPDGFTDIYGNVWDWLQDDFYPLEGFAAHPLYEDFSAPYMDKEHSMMLGGSWATTGTGASDHYRLWFRRNFYQHAGFRIARCL